MKELHELNRALATELGVSVATGEVDLLHNLTIKVDLKKEDISLSAKLIAEELRERVKNLTGVKLLPDCIGRHSLKVCIAS